MLDQPPPESSPSPKPPRRTQNLRGRKPALDDKKKGDILGVLGHGCNMSTAADYVGVHVSTIYRTARRDPAFAAEMRRARATLEIRLVRCVMKAAEAPGGWRPATWLLNRLNPESWARPHPSLMTVRQYKETTKQLVDLAIDEITEPARRRRFVDKIGAVIAAVERDAEDARKFCA